MTKRLTYRRPEQESELLLTEIICTSSFDETDMTETLENGNELII